jgi:hypothetical protein
MVRKISPWALIACVCGCIPLTADHYRLNHHWDLVGDFLYMRRAQIQNKTLVKDADKKQCASQCPNYTVIDTSNLVNDFHFEPGYRVGLTYTADLVNGFEMNFLYLQPWHAKKRVTGDESLSYPFSHATYTTDFYGASVAIAEYWSHFWDLEFNYWHFLSPRRVDYFSVSGLAGLRYFHWDEGFKLKMFNPPDHGHYDVSTENRIFGLQFGLDIEWNPVRWLSWEFFAKVGGMVDHSQQKTFLGDEGDTITLHDFKKQSREVGVYTDVAAEFEIHFNRYFSFQAGYQFMFFSGLALAPLQLSHGTFKNAGDRVYNDGTAIIHGMFAGVVFTF